MRTGQTFGELSLVYGAPRTTTMLSRNPVTLLKLDKAIFDKHIPNYIEQQVNNLLEFLKICPIFYKKSKEILLKLAIRSEIKKYDINKEIIGRSNKTDYIYIIRKGSIKVL